jgi:hypothetical protein
MEDPIAPNGRPGGTVEPANRAAVAKAKHQSPETPAATRYELRDPFAEVTYRAKTFDKMADIADQLGAVRFHAVDADGKRTAIEKVDSTWRLQEPAVSPSKNGTPVRDLNKEPPKAESAINQQAATDTVVRPDPKAERAAEVLRLEAALHERYVIKRAPVKIGDLSVGHTEYRFRGDTSRVAFTESTFRLATDNNNPSVARSMVDVAQARDWKALRVSGNEDFKRTVWLEATLRGVKTVGYEPQQGDAELLRKEREARQVNRIEPVAGPAGNAAATKQSARGGGRKAVLAALEAVLIAKQIPDKQREAVMTVAAEQLARRQAAGETHKVKVLDKAAPPQQQRPDVAPTRELQPTREQAAPTR